MNYGEKYIYPFISDNGVDYEIAILQRGYAGTSQVRPLGGSPILRRDRSENICGTSLEFPAECLIDGEYSELFTPDPTMHKVELRTESATLWSGFVCPELYSEPDIAPPYNVTVTAVDGLGELKRHIYGGLGQSSLYNILVYILSNTGVDLPIRLINSINVVAPEALSASRILNIETDLGYLAGKTCYDVLQEILSTLNAKISQINNSWLIWRENDVEVANGYVLAVDAETQQTVYLNAAAFGSMASNDWWPVGQLENKISPAYREQIITSENKYKPSALINSDMSEDYGWEKDETVIYDADEGAYRLSAANESIFQTVTFEKSVGYRLLLRILARNEGDGEDEQNLGIEVTMNGRAYSGSQKYYLVQSSADSNRSIASYVWKTEGGVIEVELETPVESDTAADAQEVEIVLPLFSKDSRNYAYADDITVRIFNPTGLYNQYIYSVQLLKYEQSAGYQDILRLGNGAREDAAEVNVAFGMTNLAAQEYFMYATPLLPSGEKATQWSDNRIDPSNYLQLIGRDYARCIALPRLIKRGRLNVPAANLPAAFYDNDNTAYWVNTYAWDILNSEVEVELQSLPIASVEIDKETISEIPSGGLSPSSGMGVPSGGGGGGGEGLIKTVLGIESLGSVEKEDNSVTFNAYAIDSLYKSIKTIEGNITTLQNNKADANKVYTTTQIDNLFSQLQASIASSYLSINGGQLHGSLRLRKGTENYGMALYFGDGSFCYLMEDSDDHLKISASKGVAITTGSGYALSVNGYAVMTSADLNGYATQSWVENRGYLTSSSLSGYATQSWVIQQKFATQSWVQGLGYATQSWVEGKGYLTNAALSGYLPKTGGTISGNLYVQGNITCDGDIAADGEISGDSLSLS